jgi:hypothetical protein
MNRVDQTAWKKRLNTVSLAQAKYLWILLALGVFYWVVQAQVEGPAGGEPSPLSFPLLNVPLPVLPVMASAPAVLFFVLLVLFGTLRAAKTVEDTIGTAAIDETTDEHPNAIDWATYTTTKSPRSLAGILWFAYPIYASVFVFEATYFGVVLAVTPLPVPGRWPLLIISGIEGLFVYILLFRFWAGRLARFFSKRAA